MYLLIVEWLYRGSAIVGLLLVDYLKAFDLIRYFISVTNLLVMGAREHILLLVIDFLQNRFQCVYSLSLETPTPNGLSSTRHKTCSAVVFSSYKLCPFWV
jgi:hypothetical protein